MNITLSLCYLHSFMPLTEDKDEVRLTLSVIFVPGGMDPFQVLQQLRCNGVPEGIPYLQEGLPQPDPLCRVQTTTGIVPLYRILNPMAIPEESFVDSRKAVEKLLRSLDTLTTPSTSLELNHQDS
ncbi:myosin-7B-like isoform X2 [Oncorhynchus tshawytscha]|uniref:myosin-7B-like isoform X2 n=1 Tax=Oncorhynchus tshawytscha TaxID=74940 RepID=UPI001C3D0A4B|nr:myosin-7B-like isoform X2 [Oncorhynchus tshawytscha]